MDSDEKLVDGYSVERKGDEVILTLSDRYGQGDIYSFPAEDALKVGVALVLKSRE